MSRKQNVSINLSAILSAIMMILCSSMIFADTLPISGDPNKYMGISATLLNQDPDPAEQGRYVELRWKIQKYGNQKLEDTVFYLVPEYPFAFDASDKPEKSIGDWRWFSDDEGYYTLYYKLKVDEDAIEDTYVLKLRSKASGSSYWQYEEEFSVRVGDKKSPKFSLGTLSTSPMKLVEDTDEAEISIELQNIGDGDAQNVVMDVSLPKGMKPSFGYSDRYNLGTLKNGSSGTAKIYIDIDENLKNDIYLSNITVMYKEKDDEDNVEKKAILQLKIPVMSRPRFEIVSIGFDPSGIHPDSKVKMNVRLKNIGNEKAESVSIRALKESSQPFEFDDKSDFIGTLKPGEEGEALLIFDVKKDAIIKKYMLDLEIRSVFENEVIIHEKTATINVESAAKENNLMIGILIIIGIVIAGVVIYYMLRRRR